MKLKFHRISEQCAKCGCYFDNLDEATMKEFEEAAPGEDCTLSCFTWSNTPCRFFQPTEED